jgi:hypothetical protein
MNMALLWKTLFGLFYEGFPVRVQLEAYVTYSCTVDLVSGSNFNNISVISWQSVLLVEETGIPGENHRPVAGH